jgi:hypothetical protein
MSRSFILLFVQSKEMARKTRKHSRKQRRRTLRRIPRRSRKGGANADVSIAPPNSQTLIPPSSAFTDKAGATPTNSDNIMGKIA